MKLYFKGSKLFNFQFIFHRYSFILIHNWVHGLETCFFFVYLNHFNSFSFRALVLESELALISSQLAVVYASTGSMFVVDVGMFPGGQLPVVGQVWSHYSFPLRGRPIQSREGWQRFHTQSPGTCQSNAFTWLSKQLYFLALKLDTWHILNFY